MQSTNSAPNTTRAKFSCASVMDSYGDTMTANLHAVYEIKDWCEENLQEFNMLIVDVVKNITGMPRKYPLIETPNEEDAFAFKMRWL